MFKSTAEKIYLIEFDTCHIRRTFMKKEGFFKQEKKKKKVTMLQAHLQLLFMGLVMTTASLDVIRRAAIYH